MTRILAAVLMLGTVGTLAGQGGSSIGLGMRIRVHTTSTEGIRSPPVDGILERVFPDSLILRLSAGDFQGVPTNQDTRYFIHVGRSSSLLRGVLIGGTAGLVSGAAVFAVAGGRVCPDGKAVCVFAERTAVKGGLIFGAVGAVVGLAIGAFSAHDIWRLSSRDGRLAFAPRSGGVELTFRF